MPKILVVDDQPDNVDLLEQILAENNFIIVVARNGVQAIEQAKREMPDVILLDIHMPEMDGYEACRRLKAMEQTKDIPIIFLTANTTEESVVKGLDLGAYDYVTKPFNERELLARLKVMLRIRSAEKKVETMALTDALTGLGNRYLMEQRFAEESARVRRTGAALACLMIDIDLFKSINDVRGHDGGDHVLKEIARRLRDNVRQYDTVIRYGGEEFVIMLPETNSIGAAIVAEKIRTIVASEPFVYNGQTFPVTISIGVYVATGTAVPLQAEAFLKPADDALYAAKHAGRNRVVVAPTSDTGTAPAT